MGRSCVINSVLAQHPLDTRDKAPYAKVVPPSPQHPDSLFVTNVGTQTPGAT